MSSTNNGDAVMSPEQEKLLYHIAQQVSETESRVKNLHSILYENGFSGRMKKIESWIDNAAEKHAQFCPVLPRVVRLEEDLIKKHKRRLRKHDVILVVLALVVSLIASLPSWIRLVQ